MNTSLEDIRILCDTDIEADIKELDYNQKLQYAREFEAWLYEEPSMFFFRKWRKWLRNRPIWPWWNL